MTSTSRTARCGPACRVVWQGPVSYTDCPYADLVGLLEPLICYVVPPDGSQIAT